MNADEEGTHAGFLSCRREVIEPAVREHRGRVVKNTGDGALVEFGSAVDAVRCALDLQQAMRARNAGVPQSRRIDLRVAINLGDSSSSQTTSTVMPSILWLGLRAWPHPAGSASLRIRGGTSEEASWPSSSIWASGS